MLRLTNLSVPLDFTEDFLRLLVLQKLKLPPDQLLSFRISRRSVDARNKSDVHFVLSVDLSLKNEQSALRHSRNLSPVKNGTVSSFPCSNPKSNFAQNRPLVVGAGPAGLFAALTLAKAGADPVLIERGKPVDQRTQDVLLLQENGTLDPDSNVQFGEGGAGAFSDGKLTCGIKSPHVRAILETFAAHGAPEEILIDQKPHIGTDRLKGTVASIRREIISLGGTVLFETRLEELIIRGGHVEGAVLSRWSGGYGSSRPDNEAERKEPSPPFRERFEFLTDTILLCIGHSARDTVQTLFSQGLRMMQKPFAMGVRIEHPRQMIDRAQYGSFAGHPALGAASYKLICHTPDGRGVYTFCMCPGGEVIAAASQPGGVVTNGMSLHARNGENSNSALLVGVRPEDFGDTHPLAGYVLQRSIEKAAFRAGGGAFRAPAQRVGDFLADRASAGFGDVIPSYRPGVTPADMRAVLPAFIAEDLKKGIRAMNAQLSGFADPDAVLTGPETRSSSPVRFSRTVTGEAEGLHGLFPVGEGAGYAGGIVSAAADGITAALNALETEALLLPRG